MDVCTLLRHLMNIPSPTGKEAHIAAFLTDYLKQRGFTVQSINCKDGFFNVYAFHEDPCIVMSTHMDTVLPDIPLNEDESYIYGRGACDAKGIIAAQIKAAEQLIDNGIGNIGLLFVVAEEGNSEGAIAANGFQNK